MERVVVTYHAVERMAERFPQYVSSNMVGVIKDLYRKSSECRHWKNNTNLVVEIAKRHNCFSTDFHTYEDIVFVSDQHGGKRRIITVLDAKRLSGFTKLLKHQNVKFKARSYQSEQDVLAMHYASKLHEQANKPVPEPMPNNALIEQQAKWKQQYKHNNVIFIGHGTRGWDLYKIGNEYAIYKKRNFVFVPIEQANIESGQHDKVHALIDRLPLLTPNKPTVGYVNTLIKGCEYGIATELKTGNGITVATLNDFVFIHSDKNGWQIVDEWDRGVFQTQDDVVEFVSNL